MQNTKKTTDLKVAEIKVSYFSKIDLKDAPCITCSRDAFKIFLTNWKLNELELRESFKVMLLNRKNIVKGIYTVSEGGVSGTVADPKLIFSVALKTITSSIVLAHNHPSGNIIPSDSDLALTNRLREAGKLLDIDVIDHIIIGTPHTYYSFADEGRL